MMQSDHEKGYDRGGMGRRDFLGGWVWEPPEPPPVQAAQTQTTGQARRLAADPGEQTNVIGQHSHLAAESALKLPIACSKNCRQLSPGQGEQVPAVSRSVR